MSYEPNAKLQTARAHLLSMTPLAVAAAVKTLLETKHLYQSVDVALDPLTEKEISPFADLKSRAVILLHSDWQGFTEAAGKAPPDVVMFPLPTVRTHCDSRDCLTVNPFNPVGFWKAPDFQVGFGITPYEGVKRLTAMMVPGILRVDVFVLSYRCQGCKGVPQVFLVRREGTRLQLAGRAPIEHLDVPKYIPAKEGQWYRGAILAFQSGQDLAGLFLLRTFVEQVAQRVVGATTTITRGGDWMDAYMKTIPDEVKSYTPSLRVLYDELSSAMHSANSQLAPFELTRKRVDLHFQAVDLYGRAKSLPGA